MSYLQESAGKENLSSAREASVDIREACVPPTSPVLWTKVLPVSLGHQSVLCYRTVWIHQGPGDVPETGEKPYNQEPHTHTQVPASYLAS